MTGTPRLTAEQRAEALGSLPGWRLVSDREAIQKTFKFNDFSEAWAFISRCALTAERLGHHPEWRNVWNQVEVTLSTHDAGGLTTLDIALAREMDRFVAER